MSDHHDSDVVWISVPLDAQTARRLANLSVACHSPAPAVAASLLHDVLKDDEDAHFPAPSAPGTMTLN